MAVVRMLSGDLETLVPVKQFDEMGKLIYAIDLMKIRVKSKMKKILTEINDRQLAEETMQALHLKLTRWVAELDMRTHEITLLNQMGKMLMSSKTIEEFNVVTLRYAEQLFPDGNGAVYMYNKSGKFMEAVCSWGKEPIEHSFVPEECWGLQRGRLYATDMLENSNILCGHIKARDADRSMLRSICVPMTARAETLGVFHVRYEQKSGPNSAFSAQRKFAMEQLAGTVAEYITLSFSNLKLRDSLNQLSMHDSLTGLFNRRYMSDSFNREIYRSKRHNISFGVIMIDVDMLKKFNDGYGHDMGDMVLVKISRIINNSIRLEDIACRYGGDEFLIIIPGTDADGTYKCAERILQEAGKLHIKNKGVLINDGIMVSIGMSIFPVNGSTVEQLIKTADNAMYKAKSSGRNCMILSRETTAAQDSLQ
jgi:diguanylate cyclase (GGDEF)-like protein